MQNKVAAKEINHIRRALYPVSYLGNQDCWRIWQCKNSYGEDKTKYLRKQLLWKILCVCVCVCTLSHVELFVPPWAVVCQVSLSWNFPGKNTGLPSPFPRDLPYPGIKLMSLESPAWASGFFTTSTTWEKAMAPHSSTLTWKIPWMEEPVHGVAKSRTWLSDFTFIFIFHFHASGKEMATHSSVLA